MLALLNQGRELVYRQVAHLMRGIVALLRVGHGQFSFRTAEQILGRGEIARFHALFRGRVELHPEIRQQNEAGQADVEELFRQFVEKPILLNPVGDFREVFFVPAVLLRELDIQQSQDCLDG
jgi:hypothetical protein